MPARLKLPKDPLTLAKKKGAKSSKGVKAKKGIRTSKPRPEDLGPYRPDEHPPPWIHVPGIPFGDPEGRGDTTIMPPDHPLFPGEIWGPHGDDARVPTGIPIGPDLTDPDELNDGGVGLYPGDTIQNMRPLHPLVRALIRAGVI